MNEKTNTAKRFLSLLLVVLIAATALTMTACTDGMGTATTTVNSTTTTTRTPTGLATVVTELGKGERSFFFNVTDADGNVTKFIVKTDELVVGTALTNLNLIDGEQGEFGLYVKTVNNITVDYDTDGKYWAFYVNGAYASSGVDTTNVEAGATYEFKVE